jgi:hypothetical protein
MSQYEYEPFMLKIITSILQLNHNNQIENFLIPHVDEIYPSGYRASSCHEKVATVLGSILASSDTVKSEGWQMKQC